jgi:hypothetical protein
MESQTCVATFSAFYWSGKDMDVKLEKSLIHQLAGIHQQSGNGLRKALVWCLAGRGGKLSLEFLERIRNEMEAEVPTRQYQPEPEHIFEDSEEWATSPLPWPFLDVRSKMTFRQTVDEAIFDIKVRLGILEYCCRQN